MDVEDSIYLELILDDSLGINHSRLDQFYWVILGLSTLTMLTFTSSLSSIMMVHVKVLFENIFISKPSFSDTALFCILFKYLTDLLKSIKA